MSIKLEQQSDSLTYYQGWYGTCPETGSDVCETEKLVLGDNLSNYSKAHPEILNVFEIGLSADDEPTIQISYNGNSPDPLLGNSPLKELQCGHAYRIVLKKGTGSVDIPEFTFANAGTNDDLKKSEGGKKYRLAKNCEVDTGCPTCEDYTGSSSTFNIDLKNLPIPAQESVHVVVYDSSVEGTLCYAEVDAGLPKTYYAFLDSSTTPFASITIAGELRGTKKIKYIINDDCYGAEPEQETYAEGDINVYRFKSIGTVVEPVHTPTETPSPTNVPTPTETPSPSETPSNVPTPTETPSPSETPSNVPTPTETPSPSPSIESDECDWISFDSVEMTMCDDCWGNGLPNLVVKLTNLQVSNVPQHILDGDSVIYWHGVVGKQKEVQFTYLINEDNLWDEAGNHHSFQDSIIKGLSNGVDLTWWGNDDTHEGGPSYFYDDWLPYSTFDNEIQFYIRVVKNESEQTIDDLDPWDETKLCENRWDIPTIPTDDRTPTPSPSATPSPSETPSATITPDIIEPCCDAGMITGIIKNEVVEISMEITAQPFDCVGTLCLNSNITSSMPTSVRINVNGTYIGALGVQGTLNNGTSVKLTISSTTNSSFNDLVGICLTGTISDNICNLTE